jgi:hypothetical protein
MLVKREDRMLQYSSLQYAKAFSNRSKEATMIILGDNQKFWVVNLAQGERLLKAGYELA